MATIKSYTDITQSKTLSKILPIESADMHYCLEKRDVETGYEIGVTSFIKVKKFEGKCNIVNVQPAWSFAALLDVLPKKYYPIKDHETDLILGKPKDKWCVLYWDATGMQDGEQTLEDNPVDACYEMILKLHKLKML